MLYSEIEAQIIMTHLKEENIDSFIDKDDAGGMHSHLQVTQGVRVIVKEEDYHKAKEIIEINNNETKQSSWICEKCKEVHEGQFKVCWSCGEER